MKSTGMIRKIDELGRIVIPKEIRNNLKIRDNDSLEIYIEDEKMVLKKYNKLISYEEKAKLYLEMFDRIFNLNLIVVDNNKVLLTSNNKYNSLKGSELTKEFVNILYERKILLDKNIVEINWFKNFSLKSCRVLFPIIDNTELLGAILLLSDKKISDYEIAIAKLYSLLIKNG